MVGLEKLWKSQHVVKFWTSWYFCWDPQFNVVFPGPAMCGDIGKGTWWMGEFLTIQYQPIWTLKTWSDDWRDLIYFTMNDTISLGSKWISCNESRSEWLAHKKMVYSQKMYFFLVDWVPNDLTTSQPKQESVAEIHLIAAGHPELSSLFLMQNILVLAFKSRESSSCPRGSWRRARAVALMPLPSTAIGAAFPEFKIWWTLGLKTSTWPANKVKQCWIGKSSSFWCLLEGSQKWVIRMPKVDQTWWFNFVLRIAGFWS